MPKEFRLQVKGSEIVAHLEKQIASCHKAIGRLEEERAAIEKLPHQNRRGPFIGSTPHPDRVKEIIGQMEFLRDHIEGETVYNLNYYELQELGLVPMRPGSLRGAMDDYELGQA